ncbi:MAG: MarR family transcriptional regulator [Actinobacteria bacterium]|nr:MarR family transcriptional regulator [Actinomycetota bacterium]
MTTANREIREIVRDEHIMRNRILRLLEGRPSTIPEIAEGLGAPPSEVTYWVMGMRKYGYVREEKEVTDEGYYRYQAIEREIG